MPTASNVLSGSRRTILARGMAALAQLLVGNGPDMILKPQPVTAVQDSPSPRERRDGFFSKTGSTDGFGAYVAIMPGRSLGLVMLSNRNIPNSERVKAAKTILDQVSISQRERLHAQG